VCSGESGTVLAAWVSVIVSIGVDLAGFWGTHGERRRWVRAERGGVWGGVSPLQPTKESGGASWAPPAGSGAAPAENGFWRILKATERSFLYLYDKIWEDNLQ